MKSTKNGILLALPIITDEMIDRYLNNISTEESEETCLVGNDNDRVLKDFIKYNFAVEPDEITETRCLEVERTLLKLMFNHMEEKSGLKVIWQQYMGTKFTMVID